MALTGNKDTDILILEQLDDKDLFSICSVNKKSYELCNKEYFWRNRYIKKYGVKASQYKPKEKSWKNFYLQTVIDLQRYSDQPIHFLRNIAWNTRGIGYSFYHEDEGRGRFIPLVEAPSWVMTNFWLLKIANIEVMDIEGTHMVEKEFDEITPNDLLKSLNMTTGEDEYIIGFRRGQGRERLVYFPIIRRYH